MNVITFIAVKNILNPETGEVLYEKLSVLNFSDLDRLEKEHEICFPNVRPVVGLYEDQEALQLYCKTLA